MNIFDSYYSKIVVKLKSKYQVERTGNELAGDIFTTENEKVMARK